MGPRRPRAWPPSTASSPTCRSPPSDARFPGDDTTTVLGGEKRRQGERYFHMHQQTRTAGLWFSERVLHWKRFQLVAEILT